MGWPSKDPDDYREPTPWWRWSTPWQLRTPVYILGVLGGAALGGFDSWSDLFPLGWFTGIVATLVLDVWWRHRRRR